MKVLHVVSTVAPRYGGPSAAVRGMSSALADLGAEVTVVGTDADGPGRLACDYHAAVRQGGADYRFFRRASWSVGWHFSFDLTRWLARHVRDFDVVEVHALFTYTTIPGSRLAARVGVPYIVRPLGTLGGWSLAQRAWKKRPYYELIEKRNLARAAAIHVTADSEAAEVAALGFGDKARVIPLGVDVTPAAPVRAPHGPPLRLLFLSRLHPKKGLELVFRALAIVRERAGGTLDVRLVVAGSGDPDYERSLRDDVRQLGLATAVEFVGALAGEAKRNAFANADAFVLTSHNENFGIAAAEALAAGLPVLLSGEVGLARDVAAAGAGIVVSLDPQPIATAIERLRDDPATRLAMGERGWRYALDNLSWRECGRKLIALYGEVIARAPRAR